MPFDELLFIPESEIRRHGPGHLLRVCWRQWRTERSLARRGIHFRTTAPEQVAAAYSAMSDAEFAAINGRQDWANWRTIPRGLSGNVPNRPLRVLDLGCGIGGSTRVLAFYCPAGSVLTGYELASPLVEIARRRSYPHRDGAPALVQFVCQGIAETLKQHDGTSIPDSSVDLVSASGVVGHHFTITTGRQLATELRRVLRPGGIALLDVGPTLGEADLTRIMTSFGFQRLGRKQSWWLDPTGQVIYKKGGDGE